jgi:DNA-binding IclR family transcriptional regulator
MDASSPPIHWDVRSPEWNDALPRSSSADTQRDGVGANGLEILSKAAAVVFALEAEGELTANEIAQRVGEPVSSTYRLLTHLAAIGWVEKGLRRGFYRLGVDFLRVGGMIEDRIDLRDICRPTLRRLLDETGATSYLCVRRGGRAVCIERLEGREVRSLAMRLGDSLPLYAGAAPLAILSFLPKADRIAYVESLGSIRGEFVPAPSQRDLLKAIDRTRRGGYSLSDGDVTPGIAAIGAPIFNHRGELEGSISISGLRHKVLDVAGNPARVIAAAAEASRRLGFDGEGVR